MTRELAVFLDRFRTAAVLSLRYLFLTRFSWLIGVVLVLIVPLCRDFFPSLLSNLLVLDLPEQVYHVSWISLWCAVTVMETLRVTTLNAQYRFEDYERAVREFRRAWKCGEVNDPQEWYRQLTGWITFAVGLAAALAVWRSLLNTCIESTANDPAPTWHRFATNAEADRVEQLCWHQAYFGMLTTLAILGTLHFIAIVAHEMSSRKRTRSVIAPTRRAFPRVGLRHFIDRIVGPGYFRQIQDDERRVRTLRLAPGHLRLFLYTTTFSAWYLVNYLSATGEQPMPTEESPYPALFYGLLSLLLLTYLLPGIAFFLDRYRIPVTLLILAITCTLYGFFETDHFYELDPPRSGTAVAEATTFDSILDRWQLPRDRVGKRTLVVVDASGGGIQAAAWSAQVLTGLHEVYGEPFSRSVGLISAVSGSSVGSMFYLVNRADLGEEFDRQEPGVTVLSGEAIDRIRWATRASALEATAWGLAYPDTMRMLFPPAVSKIVDRGWAIERVWRQRMMTGAGADLGDLRLTDLVQPIRENQLPVVVFNTTLMESGERYLISPVLSPRVPEVTGTAGALELRKEFPAAHTRLSTAARLSATFPYVTPAVRARFEDVPAAQRLSAGMYHVVDGGYSDNEGVVTSVDWLNRLLAYYGRDERIEHRPFDRVLLIRIHAFPSNRGGRGIRSRKPLAGWRTALVGPLDAMLRVRSASQTERGDLEISLLTQAAQATHSASQQRYEAEFQAAQAVLDAMAEVPGAAVPPTVATASPAETARQELERTDLRRAAEGRREHAARKWRGAARLQVEAVNIDFHSPENVLIPLSWKLTHRQKQNLDSVWRAVVEGRHPDNPLAIVDHYFDRLDSN